ncbi:MAG: hypothetical protein ACRDQ7_00575 [Haloechinothrix sp.]
MPDGQSSGGINLDNEGVREVVVDFKLLADAVGAERSGAVAYAGAIEASAENFGMMPQGAALGNDLMKAVEQLAQSLGFAATFMNSTAEAIRAAGGALEGIDTDTASTFANTQISGV